MIKNRKQNTLEDVKDKKCRYKRQKSRYISKKGYRSYRYRKQIRKVQKDRKK